MSDIPGYTEAVQTATAHALLKQFPNGTAIGIDVYAAARAVVAAALPFLERALRDRVEGEVERRAFGLAADEIRREALWQKESQMRGMFANGEMSVDRLLMLEDIIRAFGDLASTRVARGGEATE